MKLLEQKLGRALSVKQVSKYLNINEKTVRMHYQELGGIRLGRQIKFFERRIVDALEKRQKQICGADQEERSAEREGLPDVEGSESVGSKDEKNVRRRVERQDKHGLFDD